MLYLSWLQKGEICFYIIIIIIIIVVIIIITIVIIIIIIVIIIIVIIIIIIINFMQGIFDYIPETGRISRLYSVPAVL